MLHASARYAGTLSYAVRACDCRQYIAQVVRLMCTENLEQRLMNLQILEATDGDLDVHIQEECVALLEDFLINDPSEEAATCAHEALELLRR